MRTGTRNWILALLAAGFIVFFVGRGSNTAPEAAQAADTRTAMERYVDAFSQYTQAELDRFQRYQSAVAQSDWDNFWSMLVRVTLCTAVVLSGYFGFRLAPVIVARASVVRTSRGEVLLRQNSDGKFVPVPMDKPFEEPVKQREVETLPVSHNDKTELIEINKDGRVVSVVEDATDFLEKAIKVNGSHANELPSHTKMGVSGERWSKMVHEVMGGMFNVTPDKTYCAEYPDLGTTYFAIINKKVPLPEKKKAKK